jgi:UDP-glucose 4-epimerase
LLYNKEMDSHKSYLITGGFGLIGSALANKIKGKVTILTRSEKGKARIKRPNAVILLKSLNQVTKEDLKDIDIIYHCASTVDNYNILTDPYIDVETNLNGTIKLLEICKDLTVKPKIIFPSTFFVYGNEYDKTKNAINEESKTDPLAIYPATKLCAESIIKLYSKLYNIPYILARLTNVYGEEENFDNKKKGALNYLIMQAVKRETLSIYKGGNFYRDYIYTDDVVDALLFLEEKATNDTFLVGYGKSVLFKDIIDYVHTQTGGLSIIKEIEPPAFHKVVGITNFVADTRKIRSLGWSAKIDYKEGLKRIVDSYKILLKEKP